MLSQKVTSFQERDFFKERLSKQELLGLLGELPVGDLFSWRSPSFKGLGLDPESLDDERLIALMLEEPRLIRRPLLKVGDQLLIGSDLKGLEEALAKE